MDIAIFGDKRGPLPPDWERETFIGIFGDFHLDASAGAKLAAELTFIGVFGDLTVRVPAGSRVTVAGFNVLGDRKIEVAGGDGPEIAIRSYGVFSDLKVTG